MNWDVILVRHTAKEACDAYQKHRENTLSHHRSKKESRYKFYLFAFTAFSGSYFYWWPSGLGASFPSSYQLTLWLPSACPMFVSP
jgi:hypothetical protein